MTKVGEASDSHAGDQGLNSAWEIYFMGHIVGL